MHNISVDLKILRITFFSFIFSDIISTGLILLHLPKITNYLCILAIATILIHILNYKTVHFSKEIVFIILLFILDFIFLSINLTRNERYSEVFIIFVRQLVFPVAFIVIAASYDKEIIYEAVYTPIFVFIIFLAAFIEIILFNIFEDYFSLIAQLGDEQNISIFSYQTSSKGMKLRISSIFASALTFSLYLNGFYLYTKNKFLKMITVVLLILSFNRVGYLAFILLLFFKHCPLKNKAIHILCITYILSLFALYIGFYSKEFGYIYPDNSFIFKISTFISRLNGWRLLQNLSIAEIFIGSGYLQGFSNEYLYVADNLFIYKVLQNGVLGLLILYLLILTLVHVSREKYITFNDGAVLFLSYLPFFLLNLLLYDYVYLVCVICPLLANTNKLNEEITYK